MRKFLVVGLLLIAMAAWGTGTEESNKPVTIGIWGSDRPIDPDNPDSIGFYQEYLFGSQNVEFTFYHPGDGAAQPVDLDVAAGTEPDVYFDYEGRINKYANAKYAENLDAVLPAGTQDKYIPSFLDMLTKDGVLYGLPETAWAQCMVVNTTLLDRVGMLDTIADGEWTMDEFMEASKRVSELGPDYYGFVLFASGTGGDYWMLGFIPGFGAKLFDNNTIAFDSPQGIAAMEWYRDYPYAMAGAAGLTYSDMMSAYQSGRVLAKGGSINSYDIGPQAFEAGIADEPFESALVAFPHVDSVDKVPIAMGPDAGMIFRGHASPAAVQALLTLTGERSQKYRVAMEGRFPSLNGLGGTRTQEDHIVLSNLVSTNGVFDLGLSLTEYTQVRALIPPMFQAVYTGELSVREAMDRFVTEGSAILQ